MQLADTGRGGLFTLIQGPILLMQRGKDSPETCELSDWLDLFDAAANDEKGAVATQWLTSYDGAHPIRNEVEHFEAYVFRIKRYLVGMREMVWSLPDRHELFRKIKDKEVFHTGNWLRGLLLDQNGGDVIGLVRDMWLQRDLESRKGSLLFLAGYDNLEMHHNYATLMRLAAWNIAKENGMGDEVVAAATKLTLRSLHMIDSYDHTGGHAILDAMQKLCAEHAPNNRPKYDYITNISIDGAKRIIGAHPGASLIFLQYMEQQGRPSASKMLHDGYTQDDKFESLIRWLPQMGDVILALRSVGSAYEETLNALVERGFAEQEALSLPADITPDTDY
jgi:hypothetical protein